MKKFLKITGIVILVLLAVVIALPFVFKGKIVELVKKEANKQLTAKVDFDNDVKLRLLSSFPDFTVELKKLSIADTADMDTLLSVQRFSATLDIMSVIRGGKIEVKTILLDNPRIYAKVGKDGKANWDIMKVTDTTTVAKPEDTTSNFKLGLKKLEIKDGRIVYDDQQGGIYMALEGMNHKLSGDFTQDLFTMKTKTEAQAVTFGMSGLNYLDKVKANLDADLEMDMKQMKFTFKDNQLQLNELLAGFDGWLAMPGDDITMDLKFATRKADFKTILSLIPAVFTKDFANVKASGKLGLDGSVKGTYNDKTIPAFNINMLVDNGTFQYPGMHTDVRSIFIDLNVNNPDGVMDNTVINLKKLDFVLANEPFNARLLAKNPTTDPYVDMAVKGKVDLAQVAKLTPLEKGTELSGMVTADMSAKGRVSTVESGNYEAFDAKGNITAANVVYVTDSLPKTTIHTMQLNFTPQTVDMPAFTANLGNSDVTMKGGLSNFFGYFFGNGTLKGGLDVKSNLFDANQYLTGNTNGTEAPQPQDTVPLSVVEIPKNIDFTLNMAVNRLLYSNLELTGVGGTAKVANSVLTLENIRTGIFNGNVRLDGSYSTVNPVKPETKLNVNVANIEAGEAFKYLSSVKQLAPLAQYIQGKISADFNLETFLDQHMSPLLNTLTSSGKLEIPDGAITGYPVLTKLGDKLKIDRLKTIELKKVLVMFEIKDGRVALKPFKVPSKDIGMLVSGSAGLDQSLDYDIKLDVPRKLFGEANNELNTLLAEVGKKGLDLKPSEVINVNVLVGGTRSNPIIKTSLKEIAKNTLEDVKDAVKEKIEEKIDEGKEKLKAEAAKRIADAKAAGDRLIADAQKRADALKAEAQKQADAIIAEANRQADDKVKLAGNNPIAKAAAQKVADKLKKEAREKADKVVADAGAKADDTVNEARKQADKLVKDAEAENEKQLGK